MKAKTQRVELAQVDLWLIKLRAGMARRKRLATRPGHPTTTTLMRLPRPTP